MPLPTPPAGSPTSDGPFPGGPEPWSFGPSFFLLQLSGFVRDHCPPRDQARPRVALHLADGQVLDLGSPQGLTTALAGPDPA